MAASRAAKSFLLPRLGLGLGLGAQRCSACSGAALCARPRQLSTLEDSAVWAEGSERPAESVTGSQVGHGSGGRIDRLQMRSAPEEMPFLVRALSHVSIAVPDIAKSAEEFRTLLGAQELPHRGMAVVSVHTGNACLMLMQPLAYAPQDGHKTAGNPGLVQFLEKHPMGGVHHLSFTVDSVVAAKEHMESEGAPLIRDAATGEAVHYGLRSTPIIFLDPVSTSGVTCELEQVTCGKSTDRFG